VHLLISQLGGDVEHKVIVAFYKANQPKATIFDKLIAWYTGGAYSHVELIIGSIMYSSSSRDGGVRCKTHSFDSDVWDYIQIEVDNITEILLFYSLTENAKYDWLGVFRFLNPIIKQNHEKYFCSEWVTNALQRVNKQMLKVKPENISPNGLYKLLKQR